MSGSGTGTPALASPALFTVAEARAFNGGTLSDVSAFPTADIEAKAAEIAERFAQYCHVDFVPTEHTETHDGDGSDYVVVEWPKVSSVTSITINGTAVDEACLDPLDYESGIAIDAAEGIITSRSFTFTAGWSNVVIVYTAGFDAVPAAIKRAALMVCVQELPVNNAPWQADSYDAGGTSYSWSRGDGFNGNWESIPDVMKAIRLYDMSGPGIA